MKGIAAALVVSAAVAMSPAAQAATSITSVNTATSADGSFTTTFNAAGMAAAGAPFTSTLDFTTLAGALGIRVDTSANYIGGPNDTDLTTIFLSGTGFMDPLQIFPTPYSDEQDEVYRLFAFPVDAGSYTLTINGFGAPENTGLTGQLIFTAGGIPNPSAVPEPATWLMLMTGLGVIGFAMRRSRAGEFGRTNVRFNMA